MNPNTADAALLFTLSELWKHHSMQEMFSVTRPEIVVSFIQRLMEDHQEINAEVHVLQQLQLVEVLKCFVSDLASHVSGLKSC